MSKVTVILTSYNHAKYLRESIESVLNQTFTDFELIIGDDASTDESWGIIQSYTDPRIHAYRHEVNKMGGIVNETVLSGKVLSDYVAIQHSDDIWEPQKLEKQVAMLDEDPQLGAVFSNALIIGENGEPFNDTSHFYYGIFDQPNRTRYEWLNHFFYHGNALCHPSVLIRRECYEDCGVYRFGLAQLGDLDMWVRLCLKYNIFVLPEKLVRFRVRENEANSSSDLPVVQIRGQFEFLQLYNNYRNIKSPQEFLKIFPSSERYFTQEGHDLGFALGMMALDSNAANALKLFGLELLFDALNDPDRAKTIKECFDFTQSDFIALTSKNDIFSIGLIPNLWTQIQTLTIRVWALEEKEQLLLEILSSRAWRLVLWLRRIRLFLFPLDSLQTKAAQYIFSTIRGVKKR